MPLDKEGPVQDVAWVPGNMQFVVIYGYMPAVATLFDHKCKPVFSYGAGYLNTIKVRRRRPLRPASLLLLTGISPMRRLFLSRNIEGATDAGRGLV